jgi:hypothetical protein
MGSRRPTLNYTAGNETRDILMRRDEKLALDPGMLSFAAQGE